MQGNDFDPARAERLTLNLRVENRQLKARMRSTERLTAQELPASWHKRLRKLRDENCKYRTERNAALAELTALRSELDARSA
jgi:hypothetical protein